MLRIFLFGLSNRRKQPERYTTFFSPNLLSQAPSVAPEIIKTITIICFNGKHKTTEKKLLM
jgi:hypothetical protein